MTKLAGALLAALVIALAGCGGGSGSKSSATGGSKTAPTGGGTRTSAAGGGTVDACSLLTTSEVAAAGVAGAKPTLGTPWWNDAKEHDWPKHFVTHKDSGRDQGRVTDTFWERHAFEEGAVDEEGEDEK